MVQSGRTVYNVTVVSIVDVAQWTVQNADGLGVGVAGLVGEAYGGRTVPDPRREH